jgi:hypothetical protein
MERRQLSWQRGGQLEGICPFASDQDVHLVRAEVDWLNGLAGQPVAHGIQEVTAIAALKRCVSPG